MLLPEITHKEGSSNHEVAVVEKAIQKGHPHDTTDVRTQIDNADTSCIGSQHQGEDATKTFSLPEQGLRTPVTRSKALGHNSPDNIKSYKRPLQNILKLKLPVYVPPTFKYKGDAAVARRLVLSKDFLEKNEE